MTNSFQKYLLISFTVLSNTLFSQPGTLDLTFGSGGIVTTSLGALWLSEIHASAVQTDGKIIVAGSTNDANTSQDKFVVVRYNSNGTLDNTFGTGGKIISEPIQAFNNIANSLVIQSDGKIVVGGNATDTNTIAPQAGEMIVVRYLSNGNIDSSFGSNGVFFNHFNLLDNDISLEDIKISTNGKILATGWASDTVLGTSEAIVIKLNTNGTLDSTFGNNGHVISNYGSVLGAKSILLQPDGKILIGGYADVGSFNTGFIIRYKSNGTLDSNFANNGYFHLSTGTSCAIFSIDKQSDEKIVAAGFSSPVGFMVIRIDTSGNFDNNFGVGGITKTAIGSQSDAVAYRIIVQADKKIVLGGSADSDFALARYDTSGIIDNLYFGTLGKVKTDINSLSMDEAFAMSIQSDSKIILSGYSLSTGGSGFSQDFALARYNNSLYSTVASGFIKNEGVTIYPNPTKDKIYLNSISNILSVTIKSIDGKQIENVISNPLNNQIDLSNYTVGIYFLEVKTINSSTVFKVIKSN